MSQKQTGFVVQVAQIWEVFVTRALVILTSGDMAFSNGIEAPYGLPVSIMFHHSEIRQQSVGKMRAWKFLKKFTKTTEKYNNNHTSAKPIKRLITYK